MRPRALQNLLDSVSKQSVYPHEILIIDGSHDAETQKMLGQQSYPGLQYFKVDQANRGLTKQRNYGISKLNSDTSIVCFLDDDVVLEPDFFEQLLHPFSDAEVVGVDGWITNENRWEKCSNDVHIPKHAKVFDGYFLPLSSRDRLRAILGLYPYDVQPGNIPTYGHGKSSLPPTGKSYEVEHIMGGITAYRRSVFSHIGFSTFFEGYGLYEDFDFSVRASKYGKLLTNTAARLAHYHEQGGRPNMYKYGKMVIRNGWHVWRLKHPKPSISSKLKWYTISLLLSLVRLSSLTSDGFREFLGRSTALMGLFFKKPSHKTI